ncbi:PhzF family phenazine biosynthesis protein [Mycolicibacterium stellerae]|uniref:PhzF family phenazine biosynthesis protein n=1 Tax=Mycolicibacterium stellerae TaxID=2358193 RepID=UPI000F0BB7A7|nr:PhzF family phenazine biosynthesis protein [Mycolicibacterium stellerae]
MHFQLVDVFTSTPYRGNSLSVFPDAGGLSAGQMTQITGELRQFESIFLSPAGSQDHWRARIFDLFEELDFAGHPVLGAASVLHHQHGDGEAHGRWTLELASGALTVETERRGPNSFYAVLPDMRAQFLGEPSGISRAQVASWFSLLVDDSDTRLPLEVVSTGLRYLIVPVRNGALARARIADRELDVALAEVGAQYAYLLDAEAGEGRHWNNDGVVEDAATGSAAGCVAAYLHRHGRLGDGQNSELRQGRFINRPSRISISAKSIDGGVQVRVGGEVVVVGSGRLDVLPS